MIAKKFFIILELTLLCFLTGCNNVSGLDEQMIIYGIGVDKSEDSYELTVQALNTQNTEDSSSNDSKKNVTTASATGKTLLEAVKQLENQTGKKVLYSHAIVLIINEETAKDEVGEIARFFSTNHKLRPTVEVLISNSAAKDILSRENKFNAEDILSITRVGKEKDDAIHSTLRYLLGDLENTFKSAKVWYLENEDETVTCSKIAIFKEDKLLTVLDEEGTKGALLLLGKTKNISDYVNIDAENIFFELNKVKTNIKVALKDDVPVFEINLKTNIDLYNINKSINKEDVKEAINERLTELINNVITTCIKENKSDIFNFHKYLMNNYVKFFKKNYHQIADILADTKYDLLLKTNVQDTSFKN